MNQNEPRYHSAFVALAKGNSVRPTRSRHGFAVMLALIVLVGAGGIGFAWWQHHRTPGFASRAQASVPAAPVEELTPDVIEKMQNSLHRQSEGGPSSDPAPVKSQ